MKTIKVICRLKPWCMLKPRMLTSLFCSSKPSEWRSPTQTLIDNTSNLLEKIVVDNNLLTATQNAQIEQSIKDLKYPFYIGFVGEWNKGKSSIINAIIGCKIAEVDDIPATTTPTLYIHQQTDIDNDSNNNIKLCKVNLPQFEGLGIVDLPGLNSDISHGHENTVREFLPRCDQIILITDIHQVWSESERITLKYINDIGRNKDMISVINKADAAENNEVLNKLSKYRLERINDINPIYHSLFVISAHNPNQYEWSAFINFLSGVHSNWELRDKKKCDTALNILDIIIQHQLLNLNYNLEILNGDKSVVIECLQQINKNTLNIMNNAEFQQSIRDVVYGRFSKIADDMRDFLQNKLSFVVKWRKFNFEKDGLNKMILNEIERLLYKYTNINDLNTSINPWIYSIKSNMHQCIDEIIGKLKQNIQENDGHEDSISDLRRIREEILQQSINELSEIKITFDYNSIDIMIQNIINTHQRHVALSEVSALLISPAFYLFNHPLLSVMTLSASVVWLTYKLNTFSKAIDTDLRTFGNDLSEETFNAMIGAINSTLQQTNTDVVNALNPIIAWNDNQLQVIQQKQEIIEKWKQEMIQLRQEINS